MAIIVAKFGGTSIGNGERIKKAAQSVVNEYMKGNKMVVVVSAINKTTDEFLRVVDESMGKSITDKQLAEVFSMGEMTSVRVFSATVETLGVKSDYIDPYNEVWPIITDNNFLSANVSRGDCVRGDCISPNLVLNSNPVFSIFPLKFDLLILI